MRLVRLTISGFRGYTTETDLVIDQNTTVIAGRNDAGKSTLLEALALFFAGGKPELTDFSVDTDIPITVRCTFDQLPERVQIDADRTTDLCSEYLLDAENHLAIEKTWTRSKLTQPVRRAYALHPRFEDDSDPLNAKITELRKLAEKLEITDAEIEDRRVSASYRQAIWKRALASGAAELREGLVDLAGDDGKAVGAALDNYVPLFHLFRADRPGTEADQIAQDPAKAAIQTVLERHQEQLTTLSQQIEKEIRELLDQVVTRLHEIEPSLAETLHPVATQPAWGKAYSGLQFVDQAGIPLSKRGSGTRRLVLLSFFRATAERDIRDLNDGLPGDGYHRGVITAVEEPETALHADLQADIVAAMQDIGDMPYRQVLLTTHSANLLRLVPARSIRYISTTEAGKSITMVEEDGDPTELLSKLNESLGIFTDHNVRCFVLVEGRNDVQGLKKLTAALSNSPGSGVRSFADLEKAGLIAFMPIGGGGNTSLWASNLSPFRRSEVYIMDSDRESAADELKPEMVDLQARADQQRNVHVLHRREMENYLTKEAIVAEYQDLATFNSELDELTSSEDWDYLDIPMIVARAAHSANTSATTAWEDLTAKRILEKESRAKKRLAEAFGDPSVTAALISSNSDLLTALQTVSSACEESRNQRHHAAPVEETDSVDGAVVLRS